MRIHSSRNLKYQAFLPSRLAAQWRTLLSVMTTKVMAEDLWYSFAFFFAIVSLLIVILQSLISSSTKTKKDKKKKAKPTYDDDEFAVTNEDPSNSMESKQPVEVTAEALAEEEWGPVKEKKKDKKGKGKKGKGIEDEEEVKVTEEQGMVTLALGDFHSFIDRYGRACPHISGDLRRQGRGRQRSRAR